MTTFIFAAITATACAAIGYLAGSILAKSKAQDAINAAEDSATEAWELAAKLRQLSRVTNPRMVL